MKIFGVVYAKPVASAGTDMSDAEKIAAFFSFQRMKCSLGIFCRALLDHKIELFRLWRPHTKMRFVSADQFRANRIATFCKRNDVPRTFTNHTTIVRSGDFSFAIQHRQARTWGRSLRKQPNRECEHESRQLFSLCSPLTADTSTLLKMDNEELDTGRSKV